MELRAPNAARLRRLSMNAIALAIVYGNATVVLQPLAHGSALDIATPAWVRDAFLLTGMFSSYSTSNVDFILNGLRTQDGRARDRGRWIGLRLRDHFAQRHGVTLTQLLAAHVRDAQGAAAQTQAWALLARKIRARHNRLHPNALVTRVQFGSVEWPQDVRGYRARKQPPQMRARIWYTEPEP